MTYITCSTPQRQKNSLDISIILDPKFTGYAPEIRTSNQCT